jgi:hypothetical protein
MKKLLLILLCLPLLFGCGNQQSQVTEDTVVEAAPLKETQFIISNDFILADNETYINAFMESASLMNLSEQERIDLINRNREMIEMYTKRGAEDIGENMMIKKTESNPSKQELEQFAKMIQKKDGYVDEVSPVEITLIKSGSKKYKNKYTYFEVLSRADESWGSRYNATYFIEINTNSYQIFLNTYNQLEIDDVIMDIIEE